MKTKTFDAVKMMREIRDKMSREMENMTADEQAQYIRDRAAWSKFSKESEQEPNARDTK